MVLKKFEREITATETEDRLIRFINDMVDELNQYIATKAQPAKELDKCAVDELTTPGTYYGRNMNNATADTVRGLPSGVEEFTVHVLPALNGVAQVLFSLGNNELKIYARSILKTLDHEIVISEWKEL